MTTEQMEREAECEDCGAHETEPHEPGCGEMPEPRRNQFGDGECYCEGFFGDRIACHHCRDYRRAYLVWESR